MHFFTAWKEVLIFDLEVITGHKRVLELSQVTMKMLNIYQVYQKTFVSRTQHLQCGPSFVPAKLTPGTWMPSCMPLIWQKYFCHH